MQIKQLLYRLKAKINKLQKTSIEKETDQSKQKYILFTNIITLLTFLVIFLSGVALYAFTKEDMAAYAYIIVSFFFLLSIYFNLKGYFLIAKICIPIVANVSVLVSCITFSHDARLENYYIAMMIACAFLFSHEERKWLYLFMIITLINYLVEATPIHNYLPALNLTKDLEKSKLVVLISYILIILIDALAYIYLTRLRERQLLKKQKALQEVQHTLQVQNDDLETFSIAASHSLQTPVHISKFFLSKVKKNYKDKQVVPSLQNLDIIEDSLDQIDQLVSGLFSYARIIKIEESYEPCDVFQELETIRKRMEKKFTNGRIIITRAPIYISTNKILFSIIMQNLIDNGLKYNKSEIPTVEVQFRKTGNTVSFTIKDNGIGIKETDFDKIFEPFKKIHLTEDFKGNGIGLSGAKRAAERIGGKIFCKESAASGSVFQLDLPLVPGQNKELPENAKAGRIFLH